MLALLSDFTIQNVLIGAVLLGIVSGVLGSFAVLRQQSLLGDTLSHAALPGICIGFMIAGVRSLPAILAGALVSGVLAALLVLLLVKRTRLKTDAALGIALSVFFAGGVVLLTHIQGSGSAAQAGLDTFLFGQAAAMLRSDLYVMGAITLVALAIVVAFWTQFKVVTFDPAYAGTLGIPVGIVEAALTAMIALAVVAGLQLVGVILMAAMIIAPPVAARMWTDRLGMMVTLSAAFGVAAGAAGALTSALARGLSTGPLIVLAAALIVLFSLFAAPRHGLIAEMRRIRANREGLREEMVLKTLYRLAAEHGDPDYPTEQAMIDAYLGTDTAPALYRLKARALVSETRHHPEPTPHWVLTPKGRAQAEKPFAHEEDAAW